MNVKLLLVVFLGQVMFTLPIFGQFYCPPVTYVAPAVHHHIRNVPGSERSRFYTWIKMPDGYKTQVPVINGLLPHVRVQRSGNRTDLWLDYSKGAAWKPKMRGKTVMYEHTRRSEPRPRTSPTPDERPKPKTAPVPKERNRTPRPVEQSEPKREPVPVPKQEVPSNVPKDLPQPTEVKSDESTAKILKSIHDRLDSIQGRVDAIDDLSDRMKRVEERVDAIDDLSDRMKRVEEMVDEMEGRRSPTGEPVPKLDGDMRRPSEIQIPEPEDTKLFPSYGG